MHRAGLSIFALSFGRLGLQLITSLIIARIVGPSSYGIAAFVLLFASFAELLKESGLTAPIISRHSVTRDDARSATIAGLWIGICAGTASASLTTLAGLLTGIEPYITLGLIASIVFPIAGVTGVPTAALVREFRSATLGAIEAVSAVLSITIGVTLAMVGAGPASLVVQAVCYSVFLCITSWLTRPLRHLSAAPRSATARELRGAGRRVASTQFINSAFGSIDRLALGTLASPAAIGSYAQAYQLFAVPLQFLTAPAQRISVPTMSKAHRSREPLAPVYIAVVRRLTLLVWPVFVILGVVAPVLIDVVLGAAWADTAPVLRVLSLAAIAQLIGYVTGWVFLATGHASHQLRWALWSRPFVALAVLGGVPWGAEGVAWGLAIMSVLLVIPGYVFSSKGTDLTLRHLIAAMMWPAACAVACGVVASIAYKLAGSLGTSNPAVVLITCVAGGTAALGTALIIPALRLDLFAILSSILNHEKRESSPT